MRTKSLSKFLNDRKTETKSAYAQMLIIAWVGGLLCALSTLISLKAVSVVLIATYIASRCLSLAGIASTHKIACTEDYSGVNQGELNASIPQSLLILLVQSLFFALIAGPLMFVLPLALKLIFPGTGVPIFPAIVGMLSIVILASYITSPLAYTGYVLFDWSRGVNPPDGFGDSPMLDVLRAAKTAFNISRGRTVPLYLLEVKLFGLEILERITLGFIARRTIPKAQMERYLYYRENLAK